MPFFAGARSHSVLIVFQIESFAELFFKSNSSRTRCTVGNEIRKAGVWDIDSFNFGQNTMDGLASKLFSRDGGLSSQFGNASTF